MIGASRSYLLDVRNSKAAQPFDTVEYESIYDELSDKLAPLLDEISPSIMLTHGSEGEYGHPQHVLTSRVVRSIWNGPLWSFNANGHERVQVDAAWKRRLLDSYRYGTTQDAFWTPYTAIPATSPLGPWLGDTEPFLRVQ
jgi:LmbE family N-acetylglucosaminyl deacetylase